MIVKDFIDYVKENNIDESLPINLGIGGKVKPAVAAFMSADETAKGILLVDEEGAVIVGGLCD